MYNGMTKTEEKFMPTSRTSPLRASVEQNSLQKVIESCISES